MTTSTIRCCNCVNPTSSKTKKLCTDCQRRLTDLLEWFDRTGPDLEANINKAYRHTANNQGGGGAGRATAPLPVNTVMFDFLETELKPELYGYATCLQVNTIHLHTVRQLAHAIRANNHLMENGATPEYLRILTKLRIKAEQLLDPEQDKPIILGPCPGYTRDNQPCNTSLRVADGQTSVKCPTCGSEWTVNALRERQRQLLLDTDITSTITGIHQKLADCGILTGKTTIRKWADRGQLPIQGEQDGHKTYRLSDAYLLATRSKRSIDSIWHLIAERNHSEEQEKTKQ
ncbi:hypothetical protein [Bifidobacterium oedipodis]|uniref:PhnA protein n=1 Tax=Bifidobacterium oedipodis TaxID=2675322 RepID=A0A7Y0ERC5_9BIFI|nr:hypothetical protein [Bifidobacterium sp. DSM 109957]NMM93911.1 hypothetical protein [Bifidobacterium sp. DSM 109957]